MIPVVVAVFDIASGIWYAKDGDWLDAGLSAIAIIPFIGDIGEVGRLGFKAVKEVGEISKFVKDVSKGDR